MDSPSSNLKQVSWLYNHKRLSKLSDRDLAAVLVYKEGSFSFIPLTNVWRPSKKYRIFDHHTAGLNLVGDKILLIQKINYTISTPLFLKGDLISVSVNQIFSSAILLLIFFDLLKFRY